MCFCVSCQPNQCAGRPVFGCSNLACLTLFCVLEHETHHMWDLLNSGRKAIELKQSLARFELKQVMELSSPRVTIELKRSKV
mmetsp:Transcript_12017/g.21305  ORF Transcript_12017/g.21305 Transcript_12017/m.21305 type:complete len:82 (+) Transcript_12017:138-383(+)